MLGWRRGDRCCSREYLRSEGTEKGKTRLLEAGGKAGRDGEELGMKKQVLAPSVTGLNCQRLNSSSGRDGK